MFHPRRRKKWAAVLRERRQYSDSPFFIGWRERQGAARMVKAAGQNSLQCYCRLGCQASLLDGDDLVLASARIDQWRLLVRLEHFAYDWSWLREVLADWCRADELVQEGQGVSDGRLRRNPKTSAQPPSPGLALAAVGHGWYPYSRGTWGFVRQAFNWFSGPRQVLFVTFLRLSFLCFGLSTVASGRHFVLMAVSLLRARFFGRGRELFLAFFVPVISCLVWPFPRMFPLIFQGLVWPCLVFVLASSRCPWRQAWFVLSVLVASVSFFFASFCCVVGALKGLLARNPASWVSSFPLTWDGWWSIMVSIRLAWRIFSNGVNFGLPWVSKGPACLRGGECARSPWFLVGNYKFTTPKMNECHLGKRPLKRKIGFQSSFFRGELLVE